jgi:AraC family transcriptional activator of pobA
LRKIPIRKLLPSPKEPASLGMFTLRKIEHLTNGKDLMHTIHRHDFFFILVIEKGRGNHQIDFIDYKVRDNTVFFLRPGQVHELQLKAGTTGYIMEFNTEFYAAPKKILQKNYCQPDLVRFKKMLLSLKAMVEENKEKQEGFITILKANLDIFFTELLRQSNNSGSNKVASYSQERLEEFIFQLELHSAEHKEVAHYAGLMNLSAYQLNEITKTMLGKRVSEIINDHIILEAKRYLLATTNQVKEIADELGYEDPSYFIRFFKKHTGHSPESFRAMSR